MTSEPATSRAPGRRSRKPLFLAACAIAIIALAVVVVLVLAGGNKTADGTGRDQQTNVSSPTNVTNSSGGGAGGPVR